MATDTTTDTPCVLAFVEAEITALQTRLANLGFDEAHPFVLCCPHFNVYTTVAEGGWATRPIRSNLPDAVPFFTYEEAVSTADLVNFDSPTKLKPAHIASAFDVLLKMHMTTVFGSQEERATWQWPDVESLSRHYARAAA